MIATLCFINISKMLNKSGFKLRPVFPLKFIFAVGPTHILLLSNWPHVFLLRTTYSSVCFPSHSTPMDSISQNDRSWSDRVCVSPRRTCSALISVGSASTITFIADSVPCISHPTALSSAMSDPLGASCTNTFAPTSGIFVSQFALKAWWSMYKHAALR